MSHPGGSWALETLLSLQKLCPISLVPIPSPSFIGQPSPNWCSGTHFLLILFLYRAQTNKPERKGGKDLSMFTGRSSVCAFEPKWTKASIQSYSSANLIYSREGELVFSNPSACTMVNECGTDGSYAWGPQHELLLSKLVELLSPLHTQFSSNRDQH